MKVPKLRAVVGPNWRTYCGRTGCGGWFGLIAEVDGRHVHLLKEVSAMTTVHVTTPERVDPWHRPRGSGGAFFDGTSPAESLGDYGRSTALERFERDELRSSERDALNAMVSEAIAATECRSIVDAAVDRAVRAFLDSHPEARAALKTA